MRTPRSPLPCDQAWHAGRQAEAGVVWRDGEHGAEAPVSREGTHQSGHRRDVEPQGGAITDLACQPPLDGAEAWGPGEDHHRVLHR